MKPNIMDLYNEDASSEVVTVTEPLVTPIDDVIVNATFQDVAVEANTCMSNAEVVTSTANALAKFKEDFAPVEVAIAAGEITPEVAKIALQAYNTMVDSLNFTPANLEALGCSNLSTEDSTLYPESTVKLTTEGATKLIDTIKAKIMEIITRIAQMLKTSYVKIIAYALSNEDKAMAISKQVNSELTDELKDGAEVQIEFVASRMAVYGSLTKENLLALIEHANNPAVAENIKAAFDKDIAAQKFENIYTLANAASSLMPLFKSDGKGEATNVYVLATDGDSVSALVTRKGTNGEFSLAKETARVTDLTGFKGNKPLSRKDIVEIASVIVATSKKQKDLIKKITDFVEMPKVTEGAPGFLEKIPTILNATTAAYISLAMSAATSNRSALAIVANSASLYKKKDAAPVTPETPAVK